MLRWLVFGAALFFAFLLIVLYPGLKAAWIGRLLEAPEAATRRRAARTLAELGSQPALDRLLQAAREGPAPVRETAVVGLGEHPDPRAAAFLRDLRDDASVPAVVREAATSALLRHRRLYPDRR
jgi:HEAT repeat protein